MKIEVDLHTHTINSGHAYSTIDEMARTASSRGIKALAVTEHGPNMPDGPYIYYFNNLSILPKKLYGVNILKGVEANILEQGNLDLPEKVLKSLDFVAAGVHYNTGHNLKNKEELTEAVIEAMKNPLVNMITHPVNKYYPLNFKKIVKGAKKYNVILEVNASSYNPKKLNSRGDIEKTLTLCKLAKRYRVLLSLNSDAHFRNEVGDISNLENIIEKAKLRKSDVINTSKERVLNYLDSGQYSNWNIV